MNRLLAACIFAGAMCCSAANSQAGDEKSGGPRPGGGGGVILGRCCFLGIVPEPVLCEVTTEEKCYYNTAPISWSQGMTCETPCSAAGDVFAGCGTLGPGPQGCMMFNADSGPSFVLQNSGNAFGVHVWVRGTIDPQSNLCSPLTLPGLLNNTIAPCFEGCGTLVNGVECVLFQADNGGLYLLSNLGGFQVGSHVFVRGGLAPNCTTFCQQGNGCIHDNTIEPCGGGVTGACCSDMLLNPLGCIVTTQANCEEIGGSYIGDNTSCTNPTNPCNGQIGRCCFLGIVSNPPLCEVTTFANCINRPAFVSWTAGLNCDQPCTNAVTGACCVPMNIPGVANCTQATLEECEAVGGDYHGDGTNCSALGECPSLGRCCFVGIIFPPYLCDVTTEEECSFYGGSVWTQGLTCDVPCEDMPTGACCLLTAIPEGICIEATVEECAAEGGTYQGDGVPCPSNGTCMFEQGACCIDVDDGPLQYDTCIITSPAQCALQGGVYQGPFSQCILAGCCLPNGACQDADPRCCAASGGTPRNTLCNSVVCTTGPTGACCLVTDIPEGHCIVTTAANCQELNGEYRGDGTTCNPNGAPCFPPLSGACCIPSPNSTFPMCQILTQQECALAGGAYLGNGTTCPPPGAVCIGPSGACCMDIDDGPLQYDTCNVMTAAQCQ